MDDERPLSYGKKRTNSEYDNRSYKRQNTNYGHNDVSSKTIDTLYRILCPIKKIGSVLGKGGDIVNAIREETHAKIRVTDSIPGSDDRAIIVFSYAQKQEESNKYQDVSDSPFGSDAKDMKPHCSAQDALLKIHDRIAADEYIRGGVVHENADPLDDVTARILVPNNQVGCLLGKGGNIIQKLRHETTASIRITSSEPLPPCAMATDELVQISGKQIIVRRALYEISTLLHHHPRKENPPLEDIISASNQQLYPSGPAIPLLLPRENPMLSRYAPPEQWFDGYRNESSSHGLGSFNRSSVRDGVPEEFSIKVLCATEKIGSVIGKSGANVKQLERQTGARIHVEDTNPEDKERVIVVSSKEALSNPISPTIEAVLQLQRRTGEVSEKGTITTRLLVSSSKVGCLLGQGGHVIQEMRRRTRADIRVFSKSEKPKYASADEELVQISGNENVAETALSEVASRLRTRSLQGATAVDHLVAGPDHEIAASESFSRRRQLSTDIGGADPVLYDYSMGYDYPKGSDYPKSYDHLRSHEYPKSYDYPKNYDHSKGYDYTKSYDYPKYYDYPKESDYTNRYDYPKDAGGSYNTQGYPGSLRSSGYSDRSFVEVKTPKSSVLAMGGGNISDVHQVMPNASWRYLDYPSR